MKASRSGFENCLGFVAKTKGWSEDCEWLGLKLQPLTLFPFRNEGLAGFDVRLLHQSELMRTSGKFPYTYW